MSRGGRTTNWSHARAAKALKEEAQTLSVSARLAENLGESDKAAQLFRKAHTFLLHAARRDHEAGVQVPTAWKRALQWDARAQEAAKDGDDSEAARCYAEALQCAAKGFKD